MWRFICHHQSIYNLDARVLPPTSCQSVEAVPEEKYGLLKQNNSFLPQNTISVFWRPASSPDSPFLCLQWRSLPCHDDLWIWHYCVLDHYVFYVDWLACVGNAKPTRWQIIWDSEDVWGWLITEPSLLTSLWPNTKPICWQIIWVSDDLWEWQRSVRQPQQAFSTCSVSSSQPVT